jgi:hypothetical protein
MVDGEGRPVGARVDLKSLEKCSSRIIKSTVFDRDFGKDLLIAKELATKCTVLGAGKILNLFFAAGCAQGVKRPEPVIERLCDKERK